MSSERAVRFITITVESSYVRSDAHVHSITLPYEIDLEEFAERHGETYRRFVRFLTSKHKLPRTALSHVAICFFSEPHEWLRMDSADDFLTAVYAAMQGTSARTLRTQVYARVASTAAEKPSHSGEGVPANDQRDSPHHVSDAKEGGSDSGGDDDDAYVYEDDAASAYDSEGGPGTGTARLHRTMSVSSSVKDLVADLAMLSTARASEDGGKAGGDTTRSSDVGGATDASPRTTNRSTAARPPLAAPRGRRSNGSSSSKRDDGVEDGGSGGVDHEDGGGEDLYAGEAGPGERQLVQFPLRSYAGGGVSLTWSSITVRSVRVAGSEGEPARVRATVYWADPRQGMVGSYDPDTGRVLTLVDGLVIPTKVEVVDHRLYIIEEGGVWRHDGRLSYFDLRVGQLTTLLTGLDLPHGLHVTTMHNVYFMQSAPARKSSASALPRLLSSSGSRRRPGGSWSARSSRRGSHGSSVAGAGAGDGSGYQFSLTPSTGGAGIVVCLLRREAVASAVPGMNPHLAGKEEVVLYRSPARGGLPQDLVVLPSSGQLLIGFRSMPKASSPDATPAGRGTGAHARPSSAMRQRSHTSRAAGDTARSLLGGRATLDLLLQEEGGGDDTSAAAQARREYGFIEQYTRGRDGTQFDDTRGLVVLRRRAAIVSLHLDPAHNAVYCCGFGGPAETASMALSRARASTPQDFVVLRHGAAVACATDAAQNVFFLCETGRGRKSGGELDLRVLPHSSQLRAAVRERVVQSVVPAVEDESKQAGGASKGGEDDTAGKDGKADGGDGNGDSKGDEGQSANPEQRKKDMYRELSVELSRDSIMAGAFSGGAVTSLAGLLKDLSNGVNVQVVLRCRPLFAWERDLGAQSAITCRRNEVEVSKYAAYVQRKAYLFHRVFDQSTTQRQLFAESIVPIVSKALQGYNCTVFAYGQTGTGKTFTLEGDMGNPSRAGIIPRCIHHLFQQIDVAPPGQEFTITVSHLEIYNEELADLLAPDYGTTELERMRDVNRRTTSRSLWAAARRRGINMIYLPKALLKKQHDDEDGGTDDADRATPRVRVGPKGLRIVKDPARGVIVDGLTEMEVTSAEDIFDILARSIKKRVTHETQMNKQSSRSHAIFTIQIASTVVDAMGTATKTVGRLNLVDLSGSENLKRSGSVGDRQREASHINQGLLSLGRVIKGIVDKAKYIPYRDSKLTRLLEESLGGNSVTLMILTVSPNNMDADETVSTLNYANMAKMILNQPKENVKVVKTGAGGGGVTGTGGTGEDLSAPHTSNAGPARVPVSPWDGAVPIRKPRRTDDAAQAAPARLYHATSVEWVDKHFLHPATGQLSSKAVTALCDLFAKFDNGEKGFLSGNEARSLAASIEIVTDTARKSLDKAIKQVDDLDIKTEQRLRSTRKRSSSPSKRAPAATRRGHGRPPSARDRSKAKKKKPRALSAPMVPGSKLPRVRFLAYAASLASSQPFIVCQLMQSYGYGMSLEPSRAAKITDEAAAEVGLPPRGRNNDAGVRRRGKAPLAPRVALARAVEASGEPLPPSPSALFSWLDVPGGGSTGPSSRASTTRVRTLRPSSAMPRLGNASSGALASSAAMSGNVGSGGGDGGSANTSGARGPVRRVYSRTSVGGSLTARPASAMERPTGASGGGVKAMRRPGSSRLRR